MNPGDVNIQAPESFSEQDEGIVSLLFNLISKFSDQNKLILYRTFNSLVNADNEKDNLEGKMAECNNLFRENLIEFRNIYKNQKPLFRNIGFVAQKIDRDQHFREMLERPKPPPMFLPNKDSCPRTFVLAKSYNNNIILKPQDTEVGSDNFFIGFFIGLEICDKTKSSIKLIPGGKVSVLKRPEFSEPIEITEDSKGDTQIIHVISDSAPLKNPSITLKLEIPMPDTLFKWFCIESVRFAPNYSANIEHDDGSICKVPAVCLCQNHLKFNICPYCKKTYKWSNVKFYREVIQKGMQPQNHMNPPIQSILQQRQYINGMMMSGYQQAGMRPMQMAPSPQQQMMIPGYQQAGMRTMPIVPPQQQMMMQFFPRQAMNSQQNNMPPNMMYPQMPQVMNRSPTYVQQTSPVMNRSPSYVQQSPKFVPQQSPLPMAMKTSNQNMNSMPSTPITANIDDLYNILLNDNHKIYSNDPPSIFNEEEYNEYWEKQDCF